MRTASRLLSRVTAESWGWLGARQALSQAQTAKVPGLLIRKQSRMKAGTASVRVGHAYFKTRISLPDRTEDPSLFRLFSSGSRF